MSQTGLRKRRAEAKRAQILEDLGIGLRNAAAPGGERQRTKDLGRQVGNQYGDLMVLVEAAKKRHRAGVDQDEDKALAAVEQSLVPVRAAHARAVAGGREAPELDRVLVPNVLEHLLIVLELAETDDEPSHAGKPAAAPTDAAAEV